MKPPRLNALTYLMLLNLCRKLCDGHLSLVPSVIKTLDLNLDLRLNEITTVILIGAYAAPPV